MTPVDIAAKRSNGKRAAVGLLRVHDAAMYYREAVDFNHSVIHRNTSYERLCDALDGMK